MVNNKSGPKVLYYINNISDWQLSVILNTFEQNH